MERGGGCGKARPFGSNNLFTGKRPMGPADGPSETTKVSKVQSPVPGMISYRLVIHPKPLGPRIYKHF